MIVKTCEPKQITVTGTNWFSQGDHPLVEQMSVFKRAWFKFWYGQRHLDRVGRIETCEGIKTVRSGDWIINYPDGTVDVISHDRFIRDYKVVSVDAGPKYLEW